MNLKNKSVLLIHGWGGKKEHHWLTWLESELLKRNYEVHFPKIPNAYNPKCDKWVAFINSHLATIKPDIVIAHSLGVLTWWHLYEKHHYEVEEIIAVSPPTFASFPTKMSSFFPLPNINLAAKTLQTIICAKNDPNIDQTDIKELSKKMNSHLLIKEEGEHLDHFSKVYTLYEVLEIIG